MVVFLHVSPDAFGGLMRVGINQPEDHTLRGELRVKPLDLGRVTIRDRAVGADKEENLNLRLSRPERVEGPAIEIERKRPRREYLADTPVPDGYKQGHEERQEHPVGAATRQDSKPRWEL